MQVREAVTLDASLQEAWPLLTDIPVVARCLPGAQLEGEPDEDGTYMGSLDVSFGPTRAHFGGRATFEVDGDLHRIAIAARGSDTRGRTRASANVVVAAHPADGSQTLLEIDGSIDVIGPLARFAETGGSHIAAELMRSFATCLAAMVEGKGEAVEGASTPIRPLLVLWNALKRWLGSLRRHE